MGIVNHAHAIVRMKMKAERKTLTDLAPEELEEYLRTAPRDRSGTRRLWIIGALIAVPALLVGIIFGAFR